MEIQNNYRKEWHHSRSGIFFRFSGSWGVSLGGFEWGVSILYWGLGGWGVKNILLE
jgi:hypothetical protein